MILKLKIFKQLVNLLYSLKKSYLYYPIRLLCHNAYEPKRNFGLCKQHYQGLSLQAPVNQHQVKTAVFDREGYCFDKNKTEVTLNILASVFFEKIRNSR